MGPKKKQKMDAPEPAAPLRISKLTKHKLELGAVLSPGAVHSNRTAVAVSLRRSNSGSSWPRRLGEHMRRPPAARATRPAQALALPRPAAGPA